MSENLSETDVTAEAVDGSEAEELEESTEVEDLEAGNGEEVSDDDETGSEVEFVNLDGEEITLDEIREMKQGQLRQSDYTRKTQALAEQRKATQAMADNLDSSIKAIESMIHEDENDEDLEELLEDDPSEYLKREKRIKAKKDKLDKAKKTLDKVKEARAKEESEALLDLMSSEWTSKKAQDDDISLCMKYAEKLGFTNEDLSKYSDHRVYKALIDGAKYAKLKSEKPVVNKRKLSATKKTSKKAAPKQNNEQKTLGQLLYGG